VKATVTPINQRITLQLDVAFVFEALILHRMRRLPKIRCEEWLRGLLVQGFKRECRAIRKTQRAGRTGRNATPSQDTTTRFDVSAAGDQSPTPQAKADPGTRSAVIKAQHCGNTVSFAALRKVIG
jgi:hypothetical protein